MSPKNPGAPKKPRWTQAKKSAARRPDAGGPSSAHRGGAGRDGGPRWNRDGDRRTPSNAGGFRRRDDRDDRGYRGRDDRDSFRPRREDERGGFRGRDDERGYGRRDDRRDSGYARRDDRGFGPRDDRGQGRRDDQRGYGRTDDRRGRFDRDRGGRGNHDDIDGGWASSRGRQERRDDRFSGGRDDRRPYPRRDDQRGFDRRDDRRGFDRRDDRRDFGRRDDRYPRRDEQRGFDRGEGRFGRREGGFERREERYPRRDEQRGFDRGEGRYGRREDGFDRRSDDRYPRRDDRRDERPAREDRAPRHPFHEPADAGAARADKLHRKEAPVSAPVDMETNGFAKLGVPEELVKRLARDGITAPFPIQEATIPDALAGKDVLGRGRTGSGKTLAFGLPLLARLAQGERAASNRPKAIVLSPTRELAMQISDSLQPLVHVLGLRHKLVAGGMPYPPQFDALDRGVDVLIATPGRLSDLIERGACSLDDCAIVVLDEADHMADMGFLPEVTEILDKVPAGGQRLLFSATLDKGIDTLVESYLQDPVVHSTDEAQASVTTMDHHILLVEPVHKKVVTAHVANRGGHTIVFCRTKLGADRVAMQLREQGVFAAALHGGLGQGARNRVLGAFRDGELPVLVATDVAARGIHVDDVGVVLQVDPPADHKDYLHRAGRTARAGEKGTVVTLALPHQRKMMQRLADQAGLEITPEPVAPGDERLHELTGATRPVGDPIPEERLRRLLDPPQRPRRGGFRQGGRGGGRFGGQRGGRGGYRD